MKFLVLVFFVFLVSCQTYTPAPSSNVSKEETKGLVVQLKNNEQGREGFVGSGISMAPHMGGNTMIVTSPIPYEDLELGMVIAYRNKTQGVVIHRLIEKTTEGWIVQGDNNPFPDEELVTAKNLIGVVYGSFNSQTND